MEYILVTIGGAFLSLGNISEKWDMRFLLNAIAAWALSAILVLLVASCIVSKAGVGMGAIGYISSTASFLTALFAGAAAARSRGSGVIYAGLVTAAAVTTLLLTVGFLIEGSKLDGSGVLSVVTFTFSGSLAGSVFLGGKSKRKKTRFAPKQRR